MGSRRRQTLTGEWLPSLLNHVVGELVPQRLGKDRIEGIIKEEMAHITSLSKELAALPHELS